MKTSNNNDKSWIWSLLLVVSFFAFLIFVAIPAGNERNTPKPTRTPAPTLAPGEAIQLKDVAYRCENGTGHLTGTMRKDYPRDLTRVYAFTQIFDSTGRLIASGSQHITRGLQICDPARVATPCTGTFEQCCGVGRPYGEDRTWDDIDRLPIDPHMNIEVSDTGCRGKTYKVWFEAEWAY